MRAGGLVVVCWALSGAAALAQTGVSDDRVSLPDGAGSVQGLGDNATTGGNMGLVQARVPVQLPRGFAGLTPSLDLVYSSGSGSSVVGLGWDLPVPSIERLTLRGLPEYDADDELVVNGSEQLVRVSRSGSSQVYRARFERDFVRYTWREAGAGGYFEAEYPDGRRGYFGADASGQVVAESRFGDAAGRTFRYQLVEMVDAYGHRLRYDYSLVDGVPQLSAVRYVFNEAGEARYRVELEYGTRPDVVSDCKPTFEERISQRLLRITVRAQGEAIRSYELGYEDAQRADQRSRLVSVVQRGREGGRYPVGYTFRYSSALLGVCEEGACQPQRVEMGTLDGGISMDAGGATLVDLNGDGLPDIVDSSQPGKHRIFYSRISEDGAAHFDPVAVPSRVGTRSGFDVALPEVQVLDVNGDGLADLINSRTGQVLCNLGTGDWSEQGCGQGDLDLVLAEDTGDDDSDAQPLRTRFLDLDGDRRVDALQTPARDQILVRRATASGFEPFEGEPVGRTFDVDRGLRLADMNGDGLLDPVELTPEGGVRRRLNLGFARWTPWRAMTGPALQQSELSLAHLEDLNGDGLDDLVVVSDKRVRYALNRNAESFSDFQSLGTDPARDDLVMDVPELGPRTTVVFADMNGTGTRDIVWIEPGGAAYVELFPVPPNLLSRIDNGIGAVQTFHYGTAVGQRLQDSEPWQHVLPQTMTVLTRTDSWVTLTGDEGGRGLHNVTTYRYRDGFYDGVEKQLRGFARVETLLASDGERDSQEGGRRVALYDVGADDPYRAGLLLEQRHTTGLGAHERPLQRELYSYGNAQSCPVAGLPAPASLRFPVRFSCLTETRTVLQEGAEEADWVTLSSVREYDGHGNVTRAMQQGVVHRGAPESAQPCEPCKRAADAFGVACDDACTGDEAITETQYIVPGPDTGGRWILHKPKLQRRYGRQGEAVAERRYYYDGEPFVGLGHGVLARGALVRVTDKVDASSSRQIETLRQRVDRHGNVVERIDPNGRLDDATRHRTRNTFDESGLRIVVTDLTNVAGDGTPYVLRRQYSYDPGLDVLTDATDWMVVEGEQRKSARNATSFVYDQFGRRVASVRPGDTREAPTEEVTYKLESPVSRVVSRVRSQQGAAADLERVQCLDGAGRLVQERVRLDAQRYQVSGFRELNSRGAPVRVYQAYFSPSGDCDATPPEGTPFTQYHYDAASRERRRILPVLEGQGAGYESETRYLPLAQVQLDPEDLADGPHADTPTVVRTDGLGRTVSVTRTLSGGTQAVTALEYDSLGRVRALIDAQQNRKEQRHDLLGRVLEVNDPNAGLTRYRYDDAGNLISRVDARGVETRIDYDGLNRRLALWDAADEPGTRVRYHYDRPVQCAQGQCTHTAGRLAELSYPVDAAVSALLGGEPRGRDLFGYDARGQRVRWTRKVAAAVLERSYGYDNAGRVIRRTYPDGQQTTLRHDGASRVIAAPGTVSLVDYDPRGLLSRVEFHNGSAERYGYDAIGRLTSLDATAGDGNELQAASYERDRVGNITRFVDQAASPFATGGLEVRLGYDAWYRLEELDRQSGDTRRTLSWTFDGIDNVLSSGSSDPEDPDLLGSFEYLPERPNAVISAGPVALAYDEAGQLVSRSDAAFSWDFLGRLATVERDGKPVASFSHAAGTDRVARVEGTGLTLYAGSDFELRDGIGVLYTRLGRDRVARRESAALAPILLGDPAPVGAPDNKITAADAWVAGHAQSGERSRSTLMLRSAARRMLLESGDDFATLHRDHLGSLTAAVDASGRVRGRRSFRIPTGHDVETGFVDAYGFTGQEYVSSVGLIAFKSRWLDPLTLRWTRPDPLFEAVDGLSSSRAPEATNRFSYVGNNLANAIDPSGLFKLALGLWDDSFDDFAKENKADTWWDRREKNKKPTDLSGKAVEPSVKEMIKSAETIYFNANGFDLDTFKKYLKDRRDGTDKHYGVTNFELYTIAINDKYLEKTKFKNGSSSFKKDLKKAISDHKAKGGK